MKKLLTGILCLVLILSSVALISCEKQVDSIDGATAEEAYFKAMQSMENIDEYSAVIDMKVQVKLWVVPIQTVKIDDFYFYSYEGDNQHAGMPEETKAKIVEKDWGSSLTANGIFL